MGHALLVDRIRAEHNAAAIAIHQGQLMAGDIERTQPNHHGNPPRAGQQGQMAGCTAPAQGNS